jgi:hypothetical protein
MFSKLVTLRTAILVVSLLLVPSSLYAGSLFRNAGRLNSCGAYAVAVAAADVNGDGFPDLVVTHWYGSVAILLGDGRGKFHCVASYGSGGAEARGVAIADVNGDGKPDVVVGNTDGKVGVLLGNGDGTFQPAVQYSSGTSSAESVAIADVNGDRKPDLLVATQFGGAGVLLGNGDGTFQAVRNYDTGGYQGSGIAVADVNGDGIPDLLVTSVCFSYPPCDTGGMAIFLGNGDGTFQAVQEYSSGTYAARAIAVADVNGDKRLDLIMANDGGITTMLGNGDGTFQAAVPCDPGGWGAAGIAVADVNGDGKPDLLVADSFRTYMPDGGRAGLSVLLGNGDGSFQPGEIYATGGYEPMGIAVADVDGDHMPDAIVAIQCSNGRLCRHGVLGIMINSTKGYVTTTELTSNPNPSVYGQAVVLTASVNSAGPDVPGGNVVFEAGGNMLGTAVLNEGVVRLTTAKLAAGTHSITATYKGDRYQQKSVSLPLPQVVQQATSTTTIQSSRNPSSQGNPVKFTVMVTTPTTKADGTVTFKTDTGILATVTLRGGKAILTTSALPQGHNRITATYDGTPDIVGSSASLIQIVN